MKSSLEVSTSETYLAEYDRLCNERDAARDACRAAETETRARAVTIADWVARGDGANLPEEALEEYRQARAEEARLRELWFDASDVVRDLRGRRRILR